MLERLCTNWMGSCSTRTSFLPIESGLNVLVKFLPLFLNSVPTYAIKGLVGSLYDAAFPVKGICMPGTNGLFTELSIISLLSRNE